MTESEKIFARALRKIPGGVNSPVRAWKSVGGVPRIITRGKGSYLYDADGKRYIDFIGKYPSLSQRLSNIQIAAYLGISHEFLSKIRKRLSLKK